MASAQEDRRRVYSRPGVFSQSTLDRYNLRQAWQTKLPVDGRRDGVESAHALGRQLIVQLRSGTVVALNAETGSTEWRALVGTPYRVSQPLSFNNRSVLAVRGPRLFALDRRTGRQQWDIDLPNVTSAPPTADDDRLFVCLANNRMYVYEFAEAAKKPGYRVPEPGYGPARYDSDEAKFASGYRGSDTYRARGVSTVDAYTGGAERFNPRALSERAPRFLWDLEAGTRVEQPPLLSSSLVTLAGTSTAFYPNLRKEPQPTRPYQIEARLSAPVGQHGDTAYLATRESILYALNLQTGKAIWRAPVRGGPINLKPQVTDDDVYVTGDQSGLHRVARATGQVLWSNPAAQRFLAASKRYVFATDRRDRLLILDRVRGSQLGALDTGDFAVPISNEMSDRFFLLSNDGQVVCLHDRDLPTPIWTKTVVEKKPEPKQELKPLDKEPEMKKEPDKEMKKEPEKEKKEADKEKKDAKEDKKD
jgi:outer membrane protein assembly factor BamB